MESKKATSVLSDIMQKLSSIGKPAEEVKEEVVELSEEVTETEVKEEEVVEEKLSLAKVGSMVTDGQELPLYETKEEAEAEAEEKLIDKLELGIGYSLHLWKGLCFCPNYTLSLKEGEAGERYDDYLTSLLTSLGASYSAGFYGTSSSSSSSSSQRR